MRRLARVHVLVLMVILVTGVRMMMTVGFAIGRDVNQLRPGALFGESAHQPVRQILPAI